jgi:hypothetical protein
MKTFFEELAGILGIKASSRELIVLEGHTNLKKLLFRAKNPYLASGSEDKAVQVRDLYSLFRNKRDRRLIT